MPDKNFRISRRKVLAGIGGVGAASAGAGLGTSAYLNDTESFENNTITAGELDLKVDWEEHYYRGSSGTTTALSDIVMTGGDPANVPSGYTGMPDPRTPIIAIPEEEVPTFQDQTAIEAYPDTNDDGIQDPFGENGVGNMCEAGADSPNDLNPANSLRSDNDDTVDSDGNAKPIVSLDDVKPGDFGEVTFTFALCDNPGYVWLNGRILTNEEDGVTEPEADDPGENDDPGDATTTGELAEAIEVTIWYDDNCNNVRDELDVDPGGQFVLGDDDGDDGGNGEDDSPTTAEGDITGDGEDETVRATKEEPNGENPVVEHENGKISTVTVKMGDREIESVEIVDGVAVIRTPQYPENKGPMEADVDGDGDPDVRVTGTEDSGEQEKSIFEGSLFELFHEPYGPAPLPETQVASIPLDGRPITTAFASLDGTDTDGDGLPDENLSAGDGSDPDRECFAPERRHCLGFKWELPADHGNEVQSDSVAFDLGFYTEQCRHNDGSGMNDEQVGDDEPAR
jgi:predicted ribosomally synthesized peptide with SipW-like signal peptide